MFGIHQKLYLQNQDVKYLEQQIAKAAYKKLDLHLPRTAISKVGKQKQGKPQRKQEGKGKRKAQEDDTDVEIDEEEDEVRLKVRALVEKYIHDAFELSKYSIVVDDKELRSEDSLRTLLYGDYDDEERKGKSRSRQRKEEEDEIEVEPFDFALNEKLRKVYNQVEDLTTQLTKKRATLPIRLREKYNKIAETNLKSIEDFEKTLNDNESQDVLDILEPMEETEEPFETLSNVLKKEGLEKADHEEIVKDYEQSLILLQELKQGIPQRKNDLEKLRELMEYVEQRDTSRI